MAARSEARPEVSREALVDLRFRRHQLDRPPGTARSRLPDLLDFGVQDTGPDGARWAIAVRGGPPEPADLVLAWTLRGAPHAYRRDDLDAVAVATAPYDEDDAAKRVFDGSKPLRDAGIAVLDALRTVAAEQRAIVTRPTTKGDVSARLAERLPAPYLRYCRVCEATHPYENVFRLAALQAGLVLDWDTSPPVLRRVKGFRAPSLRRLAGEAEPRVDVIRNHLRFYPGARVGDVAAFLDAPVKVVKAHLPDDAVEVALVDEPATGRPQPRFVLADDLAALDGGGRSSDELRVLGPFDPYLQLRDRELLVDDAARRKDLWRTLGRPGAVVAGGEVVATWRPRTTSSGLALAVDWWTKPTRARRGDLEGEAGRLASFRGVELTGIEETDGAS